MDLLYFSALCLLCICMRLFICALWSPAGKGLTSWLSFVVSYFPIGILGQVWYLIVSIPDLFTLTYFKKNLSKVLNTFENIETGAFAPKGANTAFFIIFSNTLCMIFQRCGYGVKG